MSDPFHAEYRELSFDEKQLVRDIKETAAELYGLFSNAALVQGLIIRADNPRELSLAKTKLEEAVMWAVKGITK
jgi:hypothetical protein